KDFTLLFSAGNESTDADANGVVDLDSLLAPGTAKNCITVGGSENDRPTPSPNPDSFYYGEQWSEDFFTEPISSDLAADAPFGMAAFSSRGPTDDGRLKPDVVAPGTWILSAYSQVNHPDDGGTQYDGWGSPPNRWYKYIGGTSMSAPLTAGAATLVRDYYNDVAGLATPSSALIKATLINGAYDLTPGQYGSGVFQEVSGRPDNVQGWGRVDLANALIPDPPRTWWYDDHSAGLSTGDIVTYTGSFTTPLVVTSADEPLRVSLVWTDYPGTPPAGGLVNDLDLEVIGPDNTHYYGNGTAGDRANNVEGVDILTPTLGTFTITVRAHNVAQETQPYALVVSGALRDPSCKTLNSVALTTTEAAILPETVSVGWHVPFTATVSPSTATAPVGYAWTFGDGQGHSSVISTTAHAYETAGLYTVVVTATNCGGSLVSDSLQIEVTCRELSGVELLTSSPVEIGQNATFSAAVLPLDANPLITYTWDFGDAQEDSGTVSTTQHLYAQPGLYTVTVTATNCSGSAVVSDEALVEVVCVQLTGASASADDPVLVGQPMGFQSSVAPPNATQPITYSWDFGGAGVGSDLDGPSPTFTYTQAGTYTVSLAVTNCDGNGLALDTFQVRVQDTCQPLAGVTAGADDPVRLGEPVHFQTTTSPPNATQLISYTWNFGAAGEGSGLHGPSPVFTYTEVGTHTVTVTATNCGGQVTNTRSVVVQEADTCQALVEVTASADDPVALGRPLHFQTIISPPDADEPIAYSWTFGAAGSGSDLDGPNPVFTYTEAGTHDVIVAATNCGGSGLDTGGLAVVVTCEPASDVDFAWGPQPVYVRARTTFTASVGGGALPLTYTWRFGDDDSQVIEKSGVVSHTFGVSGVYSITLTVANPCGTAAPVTRQVSVGMPDLGYEVFLPILLRK
ncbi:MAG: PKD domain-containing protein, partial [Anaerolineae bacterium]